MNRQNYSRRTFTRYFMSEQICELELFAFNAICQSKSVLFFAPLFGSSHWTKQIIGINNIFQNIHKYRKTMDIQ